MKTSSTLDKVKASLKRGIGLAGKKFSLVSEQQAGTSQVLFTSKDDLRGMIVPEPNANGLRVLRVFSTLEDVLQDRWDERYLTGSICSTDVEALIRPPLELESVSTAYWKVSITDSNNIYVDEVAKYYSADDRPAISPSHHLRVFHVDVLDNKTLLITRKLGSLGSGLWEVTVEQVKRTRVGASGCTVIAVKKLQRSGLVEAQRRLAGLGPSLEGRPPSLRWE